jgi:hypothetical protein
MIGRLIIYLIMDGLYFTVGVAMIAQHGREVIPTLAAVAVLLILAQAAIMVIARR